MRGGPDTRSGSSMAPPLNGSTITSAPPLFKQDEKMRRRVEAARVDTRGARGMDVEDAERHRHAAPARDHMDQIGVLRIVIGQPVAFIAEMQRQQIGENARAILHIADQGRFGLGELGNLAQMRALPVERLAGMIETCQHQAGKRQIVWAFAAVNQGGADIRPGFRSRPWPLFVPPQPAFSIAGAPCVAQMSWKGPGADGDHIEACPFSRQFRAAREIECRGARDASLLPQPDRIRQPTSHRRAPSPR